MPKPLYACQKYDHGEPCGAEYVRTFAEAWTIGEWWVYESNRAMKVIRLKDMKLMGSASSKQDEARGMEC